MAIKKTLEFSPQFLKERMGKAGISSGSELHRILVESYSADAPSISSIIKWLNGSTSPSGDHVYLMSEILNCTMEDLFQERQ